MITLKYVLTLATVLSASSVALEISSTNNKCKTVPSGRSYCEFKENDVVLTCAESQTPDPGFDIKTEMLLDCGARKFHLR